MGNRHRSEGTLEGRQTTRRGLRQLLASGKEPGAVGLYEYALGVIDGRTAQEQLEVVLQQDGEGRWGLTLVAQSWGAGIGWYPQKTIALDASQIEPLQRMLAIAQGVTRQAKSRRDRHVESSSLTPPLAGEDRSLQCG
jgi:hypothetical protein